MTWSYTADDGTTHTATLIAVHPDGHERHLDQAPANPADHAGALGLRVACTCTWSHPGIERRTDAGVVDTDELRTTWDEHLWASAAVTQLQRQTTLVEQAELARDRNVAVARLLGASWADIGNAAGMRRQSAYQRWGAESAAVVRDDRGRIWPVVRCDQLEIGDRLPPSLEEVDPHHQWVRVTKVTHLSDGVDISTEDPSTGWSVGHDEVWETPVHPHWLKP